MKKITLLLIMLMLITGISSATDYTLKKTIGGVSVSTTIPQGKNVILTFSKNTTFGGWVVKTNNVVLEDATARTIKFSMPGENVEIEAIETVTQTLSVSVNGEVLETSQVPVGESITVTAVEGNGKTFSSWQITGLTGANATANPLTFTMPNNTVEIIATFIVHTHSYSEATCTTPPTCSCGATNGDALGHNYTGTVTCNVNGSTDTVQCANCTSTENQDCTHTYTISKGTETNGTIMLSATTVKAGGNVTATITPASDYSISSITVNGASVTVSNASGMTHTINSIIENKTINVTFAANNAAPNTPTITVADKTSTSITFNISGSDPDGDSLTYDVYVGGSKNGSTTTSSYTASGLTQAKQYAYYVIAKDTSGETATSASSSTYTKCSGATLSHSTSSCTGKCTACNATGYDVCNLLSTACEACGGSGKITSHECEELVGSRSVSDCLDCGGFSTEFTCSMCGYHWYLDCGCGEGDEYAPDYSVGSNCYTCDGYGLEPYYCSRHKTESVHRSSTDTCDTCSGDKKCSHDVGSSHRYCTHYTNTTLTSHSYCSHGNVGEHAID